VNSAIDSDKVIVGLSGGVDSAVAAHLLLQQGYRVEGLFMKNWEEDDREGHCSAEEDLADVERICDQLQIELHTRNFSAEYWDNVFAEFLDEYRAGRTPNPDVLCNREIKFKTFVEHATDLGAQLIATGHYAQIGREDARCTLDRGIDNNKDQTYFLHAVGQAPLSQTLFPIGELMKPRVRALAKQIGLPVHAKKDSTGICFIGERDFREFLGQYIASEPGPICTPDGVEIGTHVGLSFYTLGQRKGIGIGGRADADTTPWYVVAKELESNRLLVAQGEHPLMFSVALDATELHWVSGEAPPLPLRCAAKVRYRQPDQDCTITPLTPGVLRVQFDQPQRAVTPGQSVVFYDQQHCLGGGKIDRTFREPISADE
jgi:tRNA-specific 2-thiouridylase